MSNYVLVDDAFDALEQLGDRVGSQTRVHFRLWTLAVVWKRINIVRLHGTSAIRGEIAHYRSTVPST